MADLNKSLQYQIPRKSLLRQPKRYTGCFVMLSVITNVCNKKTKGPTLMELFTATEKLKKFFLTTRDVRYVYHGWHSTHRYDIQVLATHASTWVHRYSSLPRDLECTLHCSSYVLILEHQCMVMKYLKLLHEGVLVLRITGSKSLVYRDCILAYS
jgi:hypothetical protein